MRPNSAAWAELQRESTERRLNDSRTLSHVSSATNRVIASELIQLLFRSGLRYHNQITPITLWLVQPPNEVLAQIQEFFGDCSVVEIHELPDTCLLEAGAHKQVKGKPTYASLLLQWLQSWNGSRISIAEIQRQCGLNSSQWKEARKNKLVREYFDRRIHTVRKSRDTFLEKLSDRGSYMRNPR